MIIAANITRLVREVNSFNIRLTCMQWAFGIIVTIVIAYGFGSGWAFLKWSDREKKQIRDDILALVDNKIDQLPITSREEDGAITTLNKFYLHDDPILKTINISDLLIIKYNVTLYTDNEFPGGDIMVVTDNVVDSKINGIYPALLNDSEWVNASLHKNRWSVGPVHAGSTINIRKTWVIKQ
ncbi:hypothetical protein [Limosilactobacillus coleohominis]|uniref:hypothetical protein n=1 Tax=Limosilactobacillus coleohominis TaxID=181675 RepID=UPI0026E9737B|nr:hypothetical protein [Limosilactobacillus coleohominis]